MPSLWFLSPARNRNRQKVQLASTCWSLFPPGHTSQPIRLKFDLNKRHVIPEMTKEKSNNNTENEHLFSGTAFPSLCDVWIECVPTPQASNLTTIAWENGNEQRIIRIMRSDVLRNSGSFHYSFPCWKLSWLSCFLGTCVGNEMLEVIVWGYDSHLLWIFESIIFNHLRFRGVKFCCCVRQSWMVCYKIPIVGFVHVHFIQTKPKRKRLLRKHEPD